MTTALVQSLPANDVKIQFMEPYVSAGLNRKTEGIIPTGIYRGFTPSVIGMTIQLAGSVPQGDSVAVVSTLDNAGVPNFYNTTVRHEGNIIVNFAAIPNGIYYLVLEVRYSLISPIPLQGVTSFNIKLVNGLDLLPEHVIITRATRAGAVLTTDNTVRQDNGGPLVTATQLTTVFSQVVSLNKTDGSFFIGPTGGAYADFPGLNSVVFTPGPGGSAVVFISGNGASAVSNPGSFTVNFALDGVDHVTGAEGDGVAAFTTVQGLAMQLHQGCGINGGGGSMTAVVPLTGLTVAPHTIKLRASATGLWGGRYYCSTATPFRLMVMY